MQIQSLIKIEPQSTEVPAINRLLAKRICFTSDNHVDEKIRFILLNRTF